MQLNSLILDMMEYYKNDVKRITHFLKVYRMAEFIAKSEKVSDVDMEILRIASIIHDIGIKRSEEKYGDLSFHESEGESIAREFLSKLEYRDKIIDRVCYLVGNHHNYKDIDNIDYQILVEADLLVNISEKKLKREQYTNIHSKIFNTKSGKLILEEIY